MRLHGVTSTLSLINNAVHSSGCKCCGASTYFYAAGRVTRLHAGLHASLGRPTLTKHRTEVSFVRRRSVGFLLRWCTVGSAPCAQSKVILPQPKWRAHLPESIYPSCDDHRLAKFGSRGPAGSGRGEDARELASTTAPPTTRECQFATPAASFYGNAGRLSLDSHIRPRQISPGFREPRIPDRF